jgi:hypothetical protein
MIFLRKYVTVINDANLNDVGRTTVVFGGGASETRGCVGTQLLDTLLVVPPDNVSLGVWIGMTSRDWRLYSHKGQWRPTTGASHAVA